jgi:hypothetical protein
MAVGGLKQAGIGVTAPVSGFALRTTIRNAILLRALVAVLLHAVAPEELFAPDQLTHHYIGNAYARYWSGETLFWPRAEGPPAYFYIVAGLYYMLGSSSLIPKLLNALVGGFSVGLVYDIARRMTANDAIAMRAAQLSAYFPSLVLWSALNIRDIWIVALILLVCRQALALHERVSTRGLLVLSASVLALAQFRSYILLAVALPMLLSFLVRNRTHLGRNVVVGMLVAVVVIYSDQAAGVGRRLRTLDFAEIQYFRYWGGVGANSDFAEADISTPGKALVFLPKGVAFFLLAPFPWAISGLRQILALPEMLFFYSLLPAMFRGIRRLIRERLSDALMVLLVTAGLTFAYALGSGNAGSAYRYRAQVLSFYMIFAAVGREVVRRQVAVPPRPSASRVPLKAG